MLDELPAEERFLVDYLWDEVVLAQPRDVRQFLMHTAILTRLTGPLCDAVAQREESDLMLRELERANLFVVALDPAHEWFRYHHLFREVLLRQLRRFAPELIPDLHRRASAWLAEHGLMVDAIDHAITAGDVHYAADEIERRWLEFSSSGQATTLLGWIDRLPAETIDAHPVLALVRAGVARALGRLDEVEEWLARAESAPASADTPARGLGSSIASGVALARSMHRLALGDGPGAVSWARKALALEPDVGFAEHATASYFLGIALFYSDPDEAEPLLRNYLAVVPSGEHDVRRYYAMALLAEHHAIRGEVDAAEQLARKALQVAQANGLAEHPPNRCTSRSAPRTSREAGSTSPRRSSSGRSPSRAAVAIASNTPTRWHGSLASAAPSATRPAPATHCSAPANWYPTPADRSCKYPSTPSSSSSTNPHGPAPQINQTNP